ncbi:aspartate/glutamate racemase family protein [Candidatus Saccharibacteria bacterium]|nr:aspartate/glutamate racemase family protein [Candidatus Saccharibacteria bacterium]
MKSIGIISTSYDATLMYLEGISEEIKRRTEDVNATRLVIRYCPDFQGSGPPKTKEDWDKLSAKMSQEALDLVLKDKCCCVALATDNLREVEPMVAELHELWRCVAQKIQLMSAKYVLVLGTKDDMSSPFIREQLKQYGIEMVDTADYLEEIELIDRIIRERPTDDEETEAKELLVNFIWQVPPELPQGPEVVILANPVLGEYICSDDPIQSQVIDAVAEHIKVIVAEALEE